MSMIPAGHTSVMASRREPSDALDMFPTPPWATRALCALLTERYGALSALTCWEPACGQMHMAGPLAECFGAVWASDVHDYGAGQDAVTDFLGGPGPRPARADWVITNPPFRLALAFTLRALAEARKGVAMLVRTAWLEGGRRYDDLFRPHPPAVIAQFAERVAMTKGRWDPDASSATAYCWVIWRHDSAGETIFVHIPPGRRKALTAPDDVARYSARIVGRP